MGTDEWAGQFRGSILLVVALPLFCPTLVRQKCYCKFMKVGVFWVVGLAVFITGCSQSTPVIHKGAVTPSQSVAQKLHELQAQFPQPTPAIMPSVIEITWADGSKQNLTGTSGPKQSTIFTFAGKGEQVEITANWDSGSTTETVTLNGFSFGSECNQRSVDINFPAGATPVGSTNTVMIRPGC